MARRDLPTAVQLRADWTQMPIQDNSEVLDIVLNPANGVDWIVGIKARVDGETPFPLATEAAASCIKWPLVTAPAQRKSSLMPPIQCNSRDLPSRSREGTSGHILVAYLEVTNPRALTIHKGAELVSFVHVKDGIVIGKQYGGPKVADWTLRTRTIGHVARRRAGLAVSSS